MLIFLEIPRKREKNFNVNPSNLLECVDMHATVFQLLRFGGKTTTSKCFLEMF